MERELIIGKMAGNMWACIIKTKKRALAFIIGLTAGDFRENGKTARETGLVRSSSQMELKNMAFGKKISAEIYNLTCLNKRMTTIKDRKQS